MKKLALKTSCIDSIYIPDMRKDDRNFKLFTVLPMPKNVFIPSYLFTDKSSDDNLSLTAILCVH